MNLDRVPIREGLLSGPLTSLHQVSLMGSRCNACQETTLGTNSVCPNCGGRELESGPLSRAGTLYTYTVVRHRPPGDYKGPEPFQPFALGLVELPEGLRVMAPIEGDPAAIRIGMPLKFRAFVRPDAKASSEVVSFAFHV
jgi:uncharacterized OB-fold protein